jgi:hypothetical protein
MVEVHILALALIGVVHLIAGMAFGVIAERIKWNGLIERGTFPKPGGRR